MTSRERLLSALNHKEPDRIPLDLGSGQACKFTKHFYIKLLDYFGLKEEDPEISAKPYQLVYASDRVLDLLCGDVRNARVKYASGSVSPYLNNWEDAAYLYYTNEFGTTYRMPREKGMYYDIYETALADAEDESDDAKYEWPRPNKLIKGKRAELERYRDAGFATATCQVFGNGFLQTGPLLYGYENWFTMLLTEPGRCEAVMEKLFEKKVEWYGNLFEEYDGLLDVTNEADDFGTQNGPICSPAILRKLVFPYHRRLNDFIKKSQPGIRTTLHSCGSVTQLIPDIIEAGYDCLNPVQISANDMEPEKLKREFGKDITFWGGGISTQSTLPRGTPGQVREETKRNIEKFAPGGGFVFATVHNVQEDVPVENFIAMWEAFRENCKY